MRPLIRFFGPRDLLLKLNADLLRIERVCVLVFEWEKLNTFEVMVLVLEDRRFYKHIGFDFRACIREIIKAACLQRHGGASTIDMQFVRTVTGYKDLTLKRKIYEILLAILIQIKYTKLEILRSYLAAAFFGSHLIGADDASYSLFGKASADLDLEEASQLAAMLVYPRPLVPIDSWDRKIQRRAKYARSLYPLYKESLEQLPV